MMEITPPISPESDREHFISSTLKERGNFGFHCVGDASKRTSFDEHGFLHSGDGDMFVTAANDTCWKQCFVEVFDQLYDVDCFSKEDLDRLFKISRNRVCLLDAAQKSNIGTYGLLTGANNSESKTDFLQVRQELREFFFLLRIILNIQNTSDEYSWCVEDLLPIILKGLSLVRAQLGWLADLPSYVLSHGHIKSGMMSPAPAAFHLFHCHLELRWLHVSVLWTLNSSMNIASRFQASQICEVLQSFTSDSSLQNVLESAIELCIADLIEMSVVKFNKISRENIVHTPAFNCMCVKELWLLLKFTTQTCYNHDTKSFWKLVGSVLDLLVKSDDSSALRKGCKPLKVPNKIACADPGLFSLWLLRHIADLFCYTTDGVSCTPIGDEMDGGQLILKRVLTNLTSSSDTDESQRRVLISLVRTLMTEPWKPKPDPIMMLWEGFCRKLDSAFQLPGAPASSYAVASETIEDILNSLDKDGLSGKQRKSINSFDMFLSLLGNFLKRDRSQWKLKMCGRFCSKLSEKKVDALSEIGLYHLSQLFLTVALQTDLEGLALQFQKLVRFSETDEKRNAMVMKAQLCFVFLFAQNGKPLAPLISPLVEKMVLFLNVNQISVVQVFVDGFRYIIKNNQSLPADLHLICGEWIKQFLKQDWKDTVRNLLDLMVDLMEKIQQFMDSSNTGGGVEMLGFALRENLLPYLKDRKNTNFNQTADLSVYFTMTALEFNNSASSKDSFQSLLHHFMSNESTNILFLRRYLYRILSFTKVQNIIESSETQQIVFLQAWVRYCTLSISMEHDQDRCITKQICMLPLLKSAINSPRNIANLESSSDPLIHLIELLGSSNQRDKKILSVLIQPLRLLVPVLKATLFPTKPKDSSWKTEKTVEISKDVIVRAFFIFGKLIETCYFAIYEKNTSSNFLITLMTTLIVPQKVHDMDIRLPAAMEEGLRKSLHMILRGLHKLDPTKEKCIERFFSEMVKVYVPRFGVIPQTNPFLKIWDEPEHMNSAIYILEVLCRTLLDPRTNPALKYFTQGLHLISELVKRNESDDMLLPVLIKNMFPKCLEVVGKGTDTIATSKRPEIARTLKVIFKADAYESNSNLWDLTNDVLSQLSENYLSFNTGSFMRMLYFLNKEFRPIVERFLPIFEEKINEVISKRGCGTDKNLEAHLASLKGVSR